MPDASLPGVLPAVLGWLSPKARTEKSLLAFHPSFYIGQEHSAESATPPYAEEIREEIQGCSVSRDTNVYPQCPPLCGTHMFTMVIDQGCFDV